MGVTGNDTLKGDLSNDTFVFGNGEGRDSILDFDPQQDFIGLVEGELKAILLAYLTSPTSTMFSN